MSVQVILINFFCYAMWFASLHLLVPSRLSPAVTGVIEAFAFIPYFFITTAVTANVTVLRLLLGTGFIAVTTQLLHRGKWYTKLLMVFLVMLMMLLSEFLTAVIIPADAFSSGVTSGIYNYQLAYYSLYLFCQAVFLTALVMVGRYLNHRHSEIGASRHVLMFLLFPFSQLLLLAGLFRPMAAGVPVNPGYILLAVLLCVLADSGLTCAMILVSRATQLRAENRVLEQKISEQGAYYKALTAHYEQIRRMRHDLDNHLYTIRILLGDGKTDEAAESITALSRTGQDILSEEVENP